ncbi:uncharacterized protein LOC119734214 [Patiria miniata]|uniref:Anaphase-promoting complex subunit 11 RING-H2 finger domain-containing protein n=1 Tax=Patiria miniata TaxID=46514 RepID=A0A914AJC4_PATMI|nr:uncharacterized protein LOC119734214 [Patiria miniata]
MVQCYCTCILHISNHRSNVHSWTAVATWRWIANDDNCGICRMAFDSCCPDCKMPGDDCPLVVFMVFVVVFLDVTSAWLFFQTEQGMNFQNGMNINPDTELCMHVQVVGPVFSCISHALHSEVAELTASASAMPYVPTRVEVQGMRLAPPHQEN